MSSAAEVSPRRPGVLGWTVIGLLVVLLAAGGALGWLIWGTDATARSRASEQVRATRAAWSQVPSSAAQAGDGAVIGVLSIPALGLEWPIVSGVDASALKSGVGWYRTTAWPGEVGNTALAGLRVTHGSPFRGLLELSAGDEIVLETAQVTMRYQVTVPPSELTVGSDAGWVLDPVPGHPDVAPQQPLLTLTTAQDLVSSGDRSVAFAALVSRSER